MNPAYVRVPFTELSSLFSSEKYLRAWLWFHMCIIYLLVSTTLHSIRTITNRLSAIFHIFQKVNNDELHLMF